MTLIKQVKQYPLVLWAFALYLCSLGINLKYDVPLVLFAMASVWAAGEDQVYSIKRFCLKHWPLMLFLLLTGMSIINSRDKYLSLMVHLHWLPALLVYFAIVSHATNEATRLFVLVALVGAAFLGESVFLCQALSLEDTPDRLEKMWALHSPLLVAPNDVLFFAILIPLAIFLAVKAGHCWWVKLLGALYIVMTTGVCIYMQSRQAVGVCIIGIGGMALLWRPIIGLWVMLASVLVVLLIDLITGTALSAKLIYLFPRRYIWDSAWQMFLDRPVFGHGPGMFRIFYVEYLEKAGYLYEQVEDHRPMKWAHSLYMEQLAERGGVGFIGLLVFIGAAIGKLLRSFDNLSVLQKGVLSSWAGFMIAGIAESSLLRLWVVMALFLLAGLSFSVKNE